MIQLKRLGGRGQLWTEFFGGLVILFGVAAIFLILNQIYQFNLVPAAIQVGTDVTTVGYLNTAWRFFPVVVLVTFIFAVISKAKAAGAYAQ